MPDVYIPEAFEIMPQKRFYLLRAGFKGTTHSINDKLKEEINTLESEAKSLLEQKKYEDALRKIGEVLVRNPYRESALKLKDEIEKKKNEGEPPTNP